VGGDLRLSRARRPRARPRRRRLPRPPCPARTAAARPLRHRAHHAAGRSRAPAVADRHRRAPIAAGFYGSDSVRNADHGSRERANHWGMTTEPKTAHEPAGGDGLLFLIAMAVVV